MEKLKRYKGMRRARGKTAKRGKNPENYSMSLRIAENSRSVSSTYREGPFTSHCCTKRKRVLRRDRAFPSSVNVTEDADLGYRFARDGYHAGMIGPPTWEEAPVRLGAWLNQRTRWIKGHLQTWLVLMRNPFRTAHDMGLAGFAAMQLALAGGMLAAFAHGPIAATLVYAAISPEQILHPVDLILALCGYCVAMLATLTACALSRELGHLRAALTMPLYWPLASLAAYRALLELCIRPHHWRKTAHGLSRRRALDSTSMSVQDMTAASADPLETSRQQAV